MSTKFARVLAILFPIFFLVLVYSCSMLNSGTNSSSASGPSTNWVNSTNINTEQIYYTNGGLLSNVVVSNYLNTNMFVVVSNSLTLTNNLTVTNWSTSNYTGSSVLNPNWRRLDIYDAGSTLVSYVIYTNISGLNGRFGSINYDSLGAIQGYWNDGVPANGGHWCSDAGLDHQWFTSDDAYQTYQTYGPPYTQDFSNNNTTAFDYMADITNVSGNVTRRVFYDRPGNNGQWNPPNDHIALPLENGAGMYNSTPQLHAASYYSATYSSDKLLPLWWCWSTLTMYDSPGSDSNWFTSDDSIMEYVTHEFNDSTHPYWFTKEYVYTNPGPDNDWTTTGDDVLYRTIIATNYF